MRLIAAVSHARKDLRHGGYLDLLPIDSGCGFCPNPLPSAKRRRLSPVTGTRSGIAAIFSKIAAVGITRWMWG